MREGLRLVEEREERRKAKLEALRAAIQEGLESGPAEPFEPGELVEQIKARGHERLKAGKRGG
ncbi:type II toxin-antitoxin system ParD family antitoxin [Bradyrhizobium sp. BEA-2-5]|uniref:type II toxin-antitoxin system ParD family antitoxin n=1 Tax=Bradyrhizobium sp. BEA-2-5 TaxID=3080015 RepID=UPI00293E3A19|nr:type II toxin-antitoxin system ParD family antitoxin [Bradyrhizobium sp. BEA-2-5]WOH80328.1 type II toxin-antitoxin system ParD family antitoxin [Bradyrhizobium sp. BEA-2-5]